MGGEKYFFSRFSVPQFKAKKSSRKSMAGFTQGLDFKDATIGGEVTTFSQ